MARSTATKKRAAAKPRAKATGADTPPAPAPGPTHGTKTPKMHFFYSTSSDFCVSLGSKERSVPGSDRKMLTPMTIRFIGHRFKTNKPDEIAAVKGSPEWGLRVFNDDDDRATMLKNAKQGRTQRGAVLTAAHAEAEAKQSSASLIEDDFTPGL